MKRTITLIPALALAVTAFAQNLNPEVRVTNEYKTNMPEAFKQSLPMKVPDSLLKIDYHFDYSVFENPYKGAYEFSPYSVRITPKPSEYEGRRLWIRAGAGYVFRPEFDAVWAPVHKSNFDLSAFASFNGFAGKYRTFTAGSLEPSGSAPGHDFSGMLGAEGRLNLRLSEIQFKAGYDGIFAGMAPRSSAFNSVFADATMRSNLLTSDKMQYNVRVQYRFSADSGDDSAKDNEFRADGSLSPNMLSMFRVHTDFSAVLSHYAKGVSLSPAVRFELFGFGVDAGLRCSYSDAFSVYPLLSITKDFAKSSFYASLSGEDVYNTYSVLKHLNHFYGLSYGAPGVSRVQGRAVAGIKGHNAFAFHYDFNASVSAFSATPLVSLVPGAVMCEHLVLANYCLAQADAQAGWTLPRLEADMGATFNYAFRKSTGEGFYPSMLTFRGKAIYNWNSRVYAGLSVCGATSRTANIGGVEYCIPWYADLGVHGEYKFSHSLSFWLSSANLLAMRIHTSPLYSQQGVSVTAGLKLSFR